MIAADKRFWNCYGHLQPIQDGGSAKFLQESAHWQTPRLLDAQEHVVYATVNAQNPGIEGCLTCVVAPVLHDGGGVEAAVGTQPVLQAVQLPTRVPDLNPGLPDVHRDTLPL